MERGTAWRGCLPVTEEVQTRSLLVRSALGFIAQKVEHDFEAIGVGGAIPPESTNGLEAQLEVRLVSTEQAEDSTSSEITRHSDCHRAVCKSAVRPWDV